MAEVSIAIVGEPGSRALLWHGVLQNDAVKGYNGKILSYSLEPNDISSGFDLPKELDRSSVFCILDGNTFATALWPRYGNRSFNFSSSSMDIRMPTLLRGVHVTEDDACVTHITCLSPILLSLFKTHPLDHSYSLDPFGLSVRTNYRDIADFHSKIGTIQLTSTGSTVGSHRAMEIKCTAALRITLGSTQTAVDAVRLVTRLEHFISLLCFSHIRFEEVSLEMDKDAVEDHTMGTIPDNQVDGPLIVKLERAKQHDKVKTDLARHELVFHLSNDFSFGAAFDRFIDVYNKIERSLSWYRIIKVEQRYLEDQFFYSIRMIESVYRALDLTVAKNAEALEILDTIQGLVGREPILSQFIAERIRPIFSHPITTTSVIKDLRHRYSEMAMIIILDERRINKLRGKEAHGTSDRYSGSDYRFMMYTCELLGMLFPLLILEYCGIARSTILADSGSATYGFSKLFNKQHVDEVVNAINDRSL